MGRRSYTIGEPLEPILFDLPPLYTTPWSAPHSLGHTAALRTPGWESTPLGVIIAEGMSVRGISGDHLAIELRGRTLIAHRPDCIGGGKPIVLDAYEPPADPEALIRLIEMCTVSVARETLMRRWGWTPGAPLVPWMLMTTPIAESLLNAAGTNPFRVWSGFRSDIDVVSFKGRCEETLTCLRLGPTLLIAEADIAPGISLCQTDQTSIMTRCKSHMREAATLERGMALGEAFDFSASPIGGVLADLVVWDVTVQPDTGARIDVDMPVVNMAPIPTALRSCFRDPWLRDADFAYPLWAVAGIVGDPDASSAEVL